MTENAVNTAVTSTSSPAIPAETSAVSPATRAANRPLGTPLGKHPTRVLFLGAGELGKEVAIELMRLGAWVCAADSYAGAPAQQVAHEYRALDMANAAELQALFDEIKPDIIVPEVEAIATDVLAGTAAAGAQVVPSAEIAAICMDRERLRVLAHEELGLPTTPYRFAGSLEELRAGASEVGYPCVVKPLMSSSGKGQSLVRNAGELERAWHYGCEGSRGDIRELIIEEFIRFDSEITLLTVTQKDGPTLFCPPIGHVQKGGDYRESFQSPYVAPEHLAEAQRMAAAVTEALTGAGLWGVEFFLSHENGVYFSELSPRPHDTGMVTLAGTQNLNEFELHLRAVLGLPIPAVTFERLGATAVVLSPLASPVAPRYEGIDRALASDPRTDVRIFGKPSARVNRRMGIVVGYAPLGDDLDALRGRVKAAAAEIKVLEP